MGRLILEKEGGILYLINLLKEVPPIKQKRTKNSIINLNHLI